MSLQLRHRAFLLCPEMFEDPRLPSLRSSRPNRQLMFEALADPRHGLCERTDITVMSNEPTSVVKPRLEQWFASASSDEVLVLYYTGHGLAGDDGELHLATATANEHGSLAVTGDELAAWIGGCRARQVYVIVDASHAGAQDVRTDGRVFQMLSGGDSVVGDSPAGQPSPFTARIASWFDSTFQPTLAGLFASMQPGDGDTVDPTVPMAQVVTEPAVAATAATAAVAPVAIAPELAATPPWGAPVAESVRRRRRRWNVAGWAAVVIVVVAGGAVLTRCRDDGSKEAVSTTPTTPTTVAPTDSAPPTTTLPITTPPTVEPTTIAPTTEVPAATTTEVASEAPAATEAGAPAQIELGIPGHPMASPPCTGGWIAQLASVDSTSEFTKASVTELLGTSGSSYTYAPDSCSTFDKGGRWYVVYLGPFATKDDAAAACKASGDEDCFARQLQ